jgi:undecaprenyl-diphosphatase
VIEAFDIDQYILMAFNHQLAGYKWFFYIITQLGSPLALTLLASAAFLLGKNKIKIFAAVLIVGLLFSVVVMDDVKDLVKRPRPEGASKTYFLIKDDYSFPSGHALAIFLAASVLGSYLGRKYYIVGCVVALAVSLSRLYLGVHYPSDVLAGAVIGIIMGELLIYAAYRLGLCDNIGLLSPMLKSANVASVKYDTSAFNRHWTLSAIIFLATASSVILYYVNYAPLTVFILAVAPMLIILYAGQSGIRISKNTIITFVFVSIGLVSALSMLLFGSYVLSLAIIIITYAAIFALTYVKGSQKIIQTIV